MPKTKKTDLEALGLDELRAKFTELTGEETKDRSKKRLIGKIETELQSTEALEKGKRMREADAEPAPKKKAGKKAKARKDDADDGEEKISKLSVEELRAKHHEVLGRETKSTNKRYLVWRVQQALKGKIRVGPRTRGAGVPMKVLPMRVPVDAVEPLGEAKARLGLRSRNDLFLRAVHAYLTENGENEVAEHFAPAE